MAVHASWRVDTGADAGPLVKIIATGLRGTLAQAGGGELLSGLDGAVVTLAGQTTSQAVTLRITGSSVNVASGFATDAALTLLIDFNNPAVKPTVQGLWRHPLMALRISRLLEPATPPWREVCRRFWEQAQRLPGMPGSMLLTSTDDGSELRLGATDGEADVELAGSGAALASAFGGGNVLIQALITRELSGLIGFEHVSVLSGATQRLMLGDVDDA